MMSDEAVTLLCLTLVKLKKVDTRIAAATKGVLSQEEAEMFAAANTELIEFEHQILKGTDGSPECSKTTK